MMIKESNRIAVTAGERNASFSEFKEHAHAQNGAPDVSVHSFDNKEDAPQSVAEGKAHSDVEAENWNAFVLNSDNESLELPRSSFLHTLSRNLCKLFFRLYNRMEVRGTENLPSDGPFIVAPNHQSFLDGPLVSSALPTRIIRDTFFFAKEDHVKGSLRRAFAHNTNIILMERSSLRHSIQKLAKVLMRDKSIVIFPEGVRTGNGKLGNFKRTFAILSAELKVPIIPLRISGAYEALSRTSWFVKPNKISLEFLPVVLPDGSMSYDELADKVKNAIAQ